MIEFNPKEFNYPPYPYQIDGIKHILKMKNAAVFDEMGVGKTKQTIDAAAILYKAGLIDGVIVVAPASVRGVWDDEETGEIKKHCFVPFVALRYDAKFKGTIQRTQGHLLWITVSYSFLRSRLDSFIDIISQSGRKFLLVLDESSAVKSPTAEQAKACKSLSRFVERKVILNGTPISNSICDLWMQFNILAPEAIEHMNYFHFRARYAIMGGYKDKQVLNYSNKMLQEEIENHTELKKKEPTPYNLTLLANSKARIDKLEYVRDNIRKLKERLAPYIIRREKKDVLSHLPEKLPPVYLEAPLSKKAWKHYEEMVEEMVTWANESSYSEAVNGAVKLARLSQITSGFLGGVTDSTGESPEKYVEEIDDAKIKSFLEWYEPIKGQQVLIWSRFRAEIFKIKEVMEQQGLRVGIIIGGQSDTQRQEYVNAFKRGELDALVGHPKAGGLGLNLTNCNICVYFSLTYSLTDHLQSQDRIHRNGQTMPCTYVYLMATSPDGRQKTVDNLVVTALNEKEEISTWTMDRWKAVATQLKKK
jgi:SNF2 family DNA or RNA helicase